MTNTEQILKQDFIEEVRKELGFIAAYFMSKEEQGIHIEMPSDILSECADRINLYKFKEMESQKQQILDAVEKEKEFIKKLDKGDSSPSNRSMYFAYDKIIKLIKIL